MLRERGFWLMIPGLLLVTSPLGWAGFPPSHDGVLHVYRVLEMHRMWRAGVFFPRWAPDLVDGLGYPLFHFLGPLFPWLGALGMTLGLDLESSVKVVLALLTLLGSAGVYRLARRWGIGEGGAMAAGLAYAFAPFRVRELYWQGDFPQYLGLCLLPWTLDTLHDYLRAGGWVRWWKAGLTYALLLLSHNITAMLSTGVLLGYGGLVLWAERPPRARGGKALGVLGLGIGLAAFFVIPALSDRSLVHLDRLLRGHFDFRRHFLGLDRLLSLVPIQDQSLGNPQEVLTLGGHQVVLALPGLLALRRPGRSRTLALGAGIAVIGMIALMTSISRPLWEHTPFLAYAEFPWRWLGPAALPMALLIGLSVEEIRWARGLALAGISLAVILGAAPLLYPFGRFTVMRGATLADLQAFDRQAGLIGLTSVGELLPRWVTREIRGSPLEEDYREGREPVRLREEDLPPGSRVEIRSLHPLDQRFRVDLPREATVSFWVFAFPGWNVQVDGQPVAIWPEEGTGRLQTHLPAGSHEVRLHFAGRWDWRLLELLSRALGSRAQPLALGAPARPDGPPATRSPSGTCALRLGNGHRRGTWDDAPDRETHVCGSPHQLVPPSFGSEPSPGDERAGGRGFRRPRPPAGVSSLLLGRRAGGDPAPHPLVAGAASDGDPIQRVCPWAGGAPILSTALPERSHAPGGHADDGAAMAGGTLHPGRAHSSDPG
ncbi:6-pyruvoyl-tetrahydropterin synthase-related protein [Thermoflexus hugenholtzii]